jgi:hypothetical protein
MGLTLRKAVKDLSLAEAYADDGAVCTAIEFTERALEKLQREKRRRQKIGLIPKDTEDSK